MGAKRALALSVALMIGAGIVISQTTAGTAAKSALTNAAAALHLPRINDASEPAQALAGRVEERRFRSTSLGREMPYRVYLPPGYDEVSRRYPALYLLHGMDGTRKQWQEMGIAAAADRLIAAGKIAPLLIVMPEGERSYWVDHANGGATWGRYTAVDIVAEVDGAFRSIASPRSRAIGGLSMGAHGALQLALNYPGAFGAVGAHSLVLRRFGSAPAYFGNAADFAARDPMQLVRSRGPEGCSFALWIDIGEADPWAQMARRFDGELTELGVRHQWHLWAGDHSATYWTAHLEDYLRFYDSSLSGRTPRTTLS